MKTSINTKIIHSLTETIFAVSSGKPPCGISVIRVSGQLFFIAKTRQNHSEKLGENVQNGLKTANTVIIRHMMLCLNLKNTLLKTYISVIQLHLYYFYSCYVPLKTIEAKNAQNSVTETGRRLKANLSFHTTVNIR